MRYTSSELLTDVTAYTGFSARGDALYLTVIITSGLLSHLTVTSDALDSYMTTHFVHRWFHLEFSCETGQCAKKVLAESHFFLKHGWIHFLGFLLIPRYNHDKIREEFKQRCRKIGILHYHYGGYFFIKYILCHYAAVHSLYHKILLHHTQMRMHSCTDFCNIIVRWTSSRL